MANAAPTFVVGGTGFKTTAIGSAADRGYQAVVLDDGSILVAGNTDGASGSMASDAVLLRYRPDGSLDTAFGDNGIVTVNVRTYDTARGLIVQNDGKIVLAGFTGSASNVSTDILLIRLNPNGTIDGSFGSNGVGFVTTSIGPSNDIVNAVTAQQDGSIIVVGNSSTDANNTASGINIALARYSRDGVLDQSFGNGGKVTTAIGSQVYDTAFAVAVDANGKIVVSGASGGSTGNANLDIALLRYNSNGSLDATFGGGDGIVTTNFNSGTERGYGIALQTDGKILVAGQYGDPNIYGLLLARYTSTGDLDASFGTGGFVKQLIGPASSSAFSMAYDVTVQADGNILVTGTDDGSDGGSVALLRYTPAGVLDTSFGGGDGIVLTQVSSNSASDVGRNVQVTPDGHIVVVGQAGVAVSSSVSNTDIFIGRYNPDGSLDLSFNGSNTLGGTVAYTENGAAVVLDSNADIIDADLDALNNGNGNYAGASLVIARSGGANVSDVFSLGSSPSFTNSNGNLQSGGQTFATITNSSGQLIVTFTSSGTTATSALADTVLRAVTYQTASDAPPSSIVAGYTFNDGSGASTRGSVTVNILAVNDAPVIGNINGDSVAYTQNAAAVKIDLGGNGTVTDADSADFAGGSLNVAARQGSGNVASGDKLNIADGNGITVVGTSVRFNGTEFASVLGKDGATLTFSPFDSDASPAAVTALLHQLTFATSSSVEGTRTISYTLVDGDGTANGGMSTGTASSSVVVARNTPPVVTASAGTTAATEQVAVVVDGGLTLSDAENMTLASAKVGISGNFQTGQDVLAFTNTSTATYGNITGSYDSQIGSLTLTSANASATVAQFEAALRAVTYLNTSDTPNTDNRTISFDANDGTVTSSVSNKIVSVTAVNDAPSVTVPASVTVTEDVASAITGISFTDVDAGAFSVTVMLSVDSGSLDATSDASVSVGLTATALLLEGTVSDINAFIAAGKLSFMTARDSTGPVTLSVTINDNGNSGSGGAQTASMTTTINVTAVNDAPRLTGAIATLAAGTEDQSYTVSLNNLVQGYTDPEGATLSVTGLTASNGATVQNNNNGTYTIISAPDFNGPVTLNYTISDGSTGTTPASNSFTVNAVNDAPSDISAGTLAVDEFAVNGTLVGTVAAVDVDSTSFTYTLANNAGGRFAIDNMGRVTVANGLLLDYEQAMTHDIVVHVVDSDGAAIATDKTVTVTIGDVNPEDVTGDANANRFVGGARADILRGAGGNDTLEGGAGNDMLIGGTGTDVVRGGLNDDTLQIAAGDVAAGETYDGGDGTDALAVTGAVDLGGVTLTSIEALRFGAAVSGATFVAGQFGGGQVSTNLAVTGSAFADTLTVNLTAAGSFDASFFSFANWTAGQDRVQLTGTAGADILKGATVQTSFAGGAGNDFYFVYTANDLIDEAAGDVGDRVFAHASYTLNAGASIEIMSTDNHAGTSAINLTGNELSQAIYGNAGANILNGGGGTANDTLVGFGGNDSFYVNHAGDRVVEGVNEGASDRVYASVSYTLNAGAFVEIISTDFNPGTGAINLTGNEQSQAIFGNAGANILDGGGGTANDTLVGFGGNDIYYVNHAGDRIVEAANEGAADRVFASVSYTLTAGAAIEIMSTDFHAGLAAINLTGNELAQAIFGNAGSNLINGGLGNDTLSGFGGNDTFVFDTALSANNVDRITDFDTLTDTIQLGRAIFTGLPTGALADGAFNTGTSATQADDRIIFETATGRLFFDQDGLGGVAAQHFATLTNPVGTLSAADFMVV